jgi:hypothetical protein
MKDAGLGFRAHSGWTALVALSLLKGSPLILERQRVHLVEVFTYEFRQPYHTAEKMLHAEARAFISRVQAEAKRLAYRAIHGLQGSLQKRGYEVSRCGLLLASGKPLPGLEKILASHALIHTADGELFREALLHASARCGLPVLSIKERELLDRAEQSLRLKPVDLTRRVTELGRPLGSPWSQDEKFASLAAWLALAARSKNTSKEREEFPAA